MKIDFGSGYNPKQGYKSCDFTENPILDFQVKNYKIYSDINIELPQNSVDEFYVRNTLHHIKDLSLILQMFYFYLKNNGKLIIIDCRSDFYEKNLFLDKLWYRYIIPRPEIWFSNTYRNYKKIALKVGFKLIKEKIKNEKEIFEFIKEN